MGLLGSALFLASIVAVRRRERAKIHAVLADSDKTVVSNCALTEPEIESSAN